MDIHYSIEFFSNWHCGSGLAAGANVDALVVKDNNGLPYVPGRTIKGLLREAAEELNAYESKADTENTEQLIKEIFGFSRKDETQTGKSFFGNATLVEADQIRREGLASYLYQTFASTAIDENGIAKDNSLRRIETVVPCTLTGSILNIPKGGKDLLAKAMQMVKRMGTGRNRGYGRCAISII